MVSRTECQANRKRIKKCTALGRQLNVPQQHLNAVYTIKGFRLLILTEPFQNYRVPHARAYPKVSGLAAWSENCK